MHLCTYEFEGLTQVGLVHGSGIVNLSRAALIHSDSIARVSLIKTMTDQEGIKRRIAELQLEHRGLDAMIDAASALQGHHDFNSFRSTACQAPSSIKTLELMRVSRDGDMTGGDYPGWLPGLFATGPSHQASAANLVDRRGECVHAACPHYRTCFVEKTIRASRRADLFPIFSFTSAAPARRAI